MSPLHPLTFELKADAATRTRLGASVHKALGEPEAAMPPRYIGETPLVMSERLDAEVTRRAAMLRDWVFEQHAAGRWRDDPVWGDIGPPDCLCVDLAIVRDDAAPDGWGVRWVEFQTFLSIAATVHALHVAACAEWPVLAGLRHWDRSARFGDDWLAASRHWMAPHAHGILLEHAPRAQGSAFDLYGSARLWGLSVVDTADVRIQGDVLQACVAGEWRDVPLAVNRLILPEERDPPAMARALSRARVAWRNHPAWFDRVHKGVLPELALAPDERCAPAARWRTLGVAADRLVLKAVDSWGGADVLLNVDERHLDQLADPQRWMVQPRFEALPLMTARDGAPLFGELRLMLALEPDGRSWVVARMARVSRGPMASAAHWAARPGEGIVPLYAPPRRHGGGGGPDAA